MRSSAARGMKRPASLSTSFFTGVPACAACAMPTKPPRDVPSQFTDSATRCATSGTMSEKYCGMMYILGSRVGAAHRVAVVRVPRALGRRCSPVDPDPFVDRAKGGGFKRVVRFARSPQLEPTVAVAEISVAFRGRGLAVPSGVPPLTDEGKVEPTLVAGGDFEARGCGRAALFFDQAPVLDHRAAAYAIVVPLGFDAQLGE